MPWGRNSLHHFSTFFAHFSFECVGKWLTEWVTECQSVIAVRCVCVCVWESVCVCVYLYYFYGIMPGSHKFSNSAAWKCNDKNTNFCCRLWWFSKNTIAPCYFTPSMAIVVVFCHFSFSLFWFGDTLKQVKRFFMCDL